MVPPIAVTLLGPPAATVRGVPLRVDTRKALALLAYLSVDQRFHRRESLCALFWPEADDQRARGALRRTLSVLHHGLQEAGLVIERDQLRLDPEAVWVDADEFARLLGSLDRHPHGRRDVCPACIQPLESATALYGGGFLEGFTLRDAPEFDAWQTTQSVHLRGLQSGALERLTAVYGASGQLDDALATAKRWMEIDPWNESAHRRLMVLYAWTGDRAAALRQYEVSARALADELGAVPAEETVRLQQDIAAGRLAPPPGGPTRVLEPVALRSVPPTLVGRSSELEAMVAALATSASGHLWVVQGEAGIGKSRLLDEFGLEAQRQGFQLLRVQAYEGDADLPYGIVVQALRASRALPIARALPSHIESEMSRLLPEVADGHPGLPIPRALDSVGARARLLDALGHVLFGVEDDGRVLLLLDDLHLADESSLELVAYLIRRLGSRPVRLACAWRAESVPAHHPLRKLPQRPSATTWIELSSLPASAIQELVSGAGVKAERLGDLVGLSGGNPFVLNEYLAADGAFDQVTPDNVRALLSSRLAGLDDVAVAVLTTASVIGRPCDVELVAAVGEIDEAVAVSSLEELLTRRLLREIDAETGVCAFSHELLRRHVYGLLSSARRRRLHRRTADALAARALGRWGSGATEIAAHYRLGGRAEEGGSYLIQAGERARALAAFGEAAASFEAAIELGHPDQIDLLEAAGDVLVLTGRYGRALEHYGEAVRRRDGVDAARLERKIGNLHARLWDWESARHHLDRAALVIGRRGPVADRALLAADRAVVAHRLGDEEAANDLAAESLGLAAHAGDASVAVQAQNVLGLLAADRGDDGNAEALLEQGLSAAGDLPELEVAILNNLALVMGRTQRVGEGIELLERALSRNHDVGDRHREAALRSNLADLYRAMGMDEIAMAELKRSAALFAEVGREPGSLEPEIWRLHEW